MDSGCIIIPILDNFEWPNAVDLPEDIRSLQRFNGVHWNHDYQEASINKLAEYVLLLFYLSLCYAHSYEIFSFQIHETKDTMPCDVVDKCSKPISK